MCERESFDCDDDGDGNEERERKRERESESENDRESGLLLSNKSWSTPNGAKRRRFEKERRKEKQLMRKTHHCFFRPWLKGK